MKLQKHTKQNVITRLSYPEYSKEQPYTMQEAAETVNRKLNY